MTQEPVKLGVPVVVHIDLSDDDDPIWWDNFISTVEWKFIVESEMEKGEVYSYIIGNNYNREVYAIARDKLGPLEKRVKLIQNNDSKFTAIFPDEKTYSMFLLKWS